MMRRQARQRREYLYRKHVEERQRTIQEKKEKVKKALDNSHILPSTLRKEAISIADKLDWDDEGGEGIVNHEDDEYRWAGVEDPKIMITTSRDPSTKLKQFAKELKLIIPNAQRLNRGNYEMKQLVSACRSNNVTDFVLVHEHRGQPDTLIISHLPYGPTATFSLANVVMRHDIPNIGTMSEQYPHLIFQNFKSRLGNRVMNILKVCTFNIEALA
jgi:U3 small nucleolar ribonucleoprotein protein IMP4